MRNKYEIFLVALQTKLKIQKYVRLFIKYTIMMVWIITCYWIDGLCYLNKGCDQSHSIRGLLDRMSSLFAESEKTREKRKEKMLK